MEFLLSKNNGESLAIEVVETGDSYEIKMGQEIIHIPQKELKNWQGLSYLQNGNLYVTCEDLQQAFEFGPKPKASEASGLAHTQLKALFPGKVVKILAKENSWVDEGTLLVVMESMKMEYDYNAPKRIFIEKILVEEGQVLAKGNEFFQTHE